MQRNHGGHAGAVGRLLGNLFRLVDEITPARALRVAAGIDLGFDLAGERVETLLHGACILARQGARVKPGLDQFAALRQCAAPFDAVHDASVEGLELFKHGILLRGVFGALLFQFLEMLAGRRIGAIAGAAEALPESLGGRVVSLVQFLPAFLKIANRLGKFFGGRRRAVCFHLPRVDRLCGLGCGLFSGFRHRGSIAGCVGCGLTDRPGERR